MSKKAFSKLTSLVLALTLMISCIGGTTAFAAEVSESSTYSTNVNIPYAGEATNFLRALGVSEYIFRNQETMGTITMSNNPSTHRLVLSLACMKAASDNGIGDVKLTIRLIRSNGTYAFNKTIVCPYGAPAIYNSLNSGDNISVSPGERLTVWVDASSVNPSQSNGNYRSIDIYQLDFYSD